MRSHQRRQRFGDGEASLSTLGAGYGTTVAERGRRRGAHPALRHRFYTPVDVSKPYRSDRARPGRLGSDDPPLWTWKARTRSAQCCLTRPHVVRAEDLIVNEPFHQVEQTPRVGEGRASGLRAGFEKWSYCFVTPHQHIHQPPASVLPPLGGSGLARSRQLGWHRGGCARGASQAPRLRLAAMPSTGLGRRHHGAQRRWCGDITYIPTWDGWLFLATVIDLTPRRIVGSATADHLRTDLIDQARTNAVTSRRPTRGVIFHSDRGYQYTSRQYAPGRPAWRAPLGRPSRPVLGQRRRRVVVLHHRDRAARPTPWPTRAATHKAIFNWIEGWSPAADTPHWTTSGDHFSRPGSTNNQIYFR
jgi:Integrase core domain